MSKINNFKKQNQSLLSDLSTINAYIKQLDISVELVNELFKLGARKKDFRVLLSNFGEIKNNDFTRCFLSAKKKPANCWLVLTFYLSLIIL
jgi:hypothetical protein